MMKFIADLLDPLGFVVLLLGFALALALIVAPVPWTVEAVLGRRIGVYLGYVVMFAAALLIVGFTHSEIMECGLFGRSGCSALSSPNCDCEFSVPLQLLTIFFTFVTMPLLFVSQKRLKKWSQSRRA